MTSRCLCGGWWSGSIGRSGEAVSETDPTFPYIPNSLSSAHPLQCKGPKLSTACIYLFNIIYFYLYFYLYFYFIFISLSFYNLYLSLFYIYSFKFFLNFYLYVLIFFICSKIYLWRCSGRQTFIYVEEHYSWSAAQVLRPVYTCIHFFVFCW